MTTLNPVSTVMLDDVLRPLEEAKRALRLLGEWTTGETEDGIIRAACLLEDASYFVGKAAGAAIREVAA